MHKREFVPLLFGGDINVYSMARAFHEAYGVTSYVFGKYASSPCADSKIIDYVANAENERDGYMMRHIADFAATHWDATVLLLGCGDSYVKRIAANLDRMPSNVVAPYISSELMEKLIHKERFYEMCAQQGIDYPDTFVYRREMGHAFTLPFDAPYIVKPANSVMYWEYPFEGQKKVYKAEDRQKLEEILDAIYTAGYQDSVIIQDFIPGDDTYMRVLTNYSDQNGRVRLMALGHVLLEEHTPKGIGNHAVIVNESNPELCEKLRGFLDGLHFVGFSNFDIKYDQRDGKYKVFEINVRQGRSNYYVTGSGYNLAKILVEDRVFGKELPFVMADNQCLWSVVPPQVMFTYIKQPEYQQLMRRLMDEGKISNSLVYRNDRSPMRALRQMKINHDHIKKYETYMGGRA